MSRVLLTGSNGQLGSELRRSLKSLGEIITPSRNAFDLAEPESLRKKIQEWRPDLIVNAAAYTAVDQAESQSEIAFRVNAEAPRVIAEEAQKLFIPIVHFSTDYVFDGQQQVPYTEKDSPNPLNVYGESKLQGEQSIQSNADQYLIIRTSWIYSQQGHNFLRTMLRLFRENDEIRVVDDQIGSPTSTRNIAEITGLLLRKVLKKKNKSNWGLYHLTAGGQTTWFGFAELIKILTQANKNIKIIPINSEAFPTKAQRPKMSLLNNTKLEAELGIRQLDWKRWLKLEIEDR